MKRSSKDDNDLGGSVVSQRARPIRSALQILIRDRIKSRAEKESLAKFMGQSLSAIDAMLYYGEGGLDSWISAFIYCYGLEPDAISRIVQSYRADSRRLQPLGVGERAWLEVEQGLSDEAKLYWASMIRASKGIESELGRTKRGKSSQPVLIASERSNARSRKRKTSN
jgi:hypothetical protein